MANATAASRYAAAMIEIAASNNAVDAIAGDLTKFADLMDAHDGLLGSALRSPVFTLEERQKVLDRMLPKLELHPLAQNLIRLVNDKRRLNLYHEIVARYTELADERAGRLRVQVETAEPMSEDLEAEVRRALETQTGKSIVLHAVVVPELIGGMVARVGGKVYDSSVRTRLQQIKSALLQGAIPAQA